jgi:hypothetical protein
MVEGQERMVRGDIVPFRNILDCFCWGSRHAGNVGTDSDCYSRALASGQRGRGRGEPTDLERICVGNNPLNVTDPSGESWFSILAGVIAGIATLNPGVGLGVAGLFTSFENVMSGNPPTMDLFGGIGNLRTLTGCGGPLGTCGMLGAGPWSELTGLGSVQGPDRFIFDAQKAQQWVFR